MTAHLSLQYRMHPAISAFPNRYFYAGLLGDGPRMAELCSRPWHRHHLLAPYRFIDIPGQERNQVRRSGDSGTSKSNEMEAKACCSLIAYLCDMAKDINVLSSEAFLWLTHVVSLRGRLAW